MNERWEIMCSFYLKWMGFARGESGAGWGAEQRLYGGLELLACIDQDRIAIPMLCEICHKREALVHLTTTETYHAVEAPLGTEVPPVMSDERVISSQGPESVREQHFCKECADSFYASTPELNSSRDLICLSEWYRSKLYDLLEAESPEAFDNRDSEACQRGSGLMREFLRKNLKNAGLEMNEVAFEILCMDFFCSHHFYNRADEFERRKG